VLGGPIKVLAALDASVALFQYTTMQVTKLGWIDRINFRDAVPRASCSTCPRTAPSAAA
jgi:hypothetical protein